MDKEKIDLNAPAFGPGAQKVEETPVEAVAEPVVEAPKKEVIEKVVEVTPSVEESKVPYSRFKKFHDEAKQYQQEAAEWKAKAEAIKPEPVIDHQDEAYKLWLENFGDNEVAQKAWKNQQRINEIQREKDLQEARTAALEAIRSERQEETQRVNQNLETIDENFELLSDFIGRQLTDKEQSAVLDIVDDYTPKDGEGNYLGAVLPFDKAWEIYELKQNASKAPAQKARDNVASLSGAASAGEPSAVEEQNKNFNPLDWGAYKNRL